MSESETDKLKELKSYLIVIDIWLSLECIHVDRCNVIKIDSNFWFSKMFNKIH